MGIYALCFLSARNPVAREMWATDLELRCICVMRPGPARAGDN